MRKSAVLVGVLAVFAFAAAFAWSDKSPDRSPQSTAQPAARKLGLHVQGRDVVEAGGTPFVMRGISHPYAWMKDQGQAFADVKRLGANTVRVVLTSEVGASEVADVIATCKQQRLICVLENHDTTGYGDQAGAATLDRVADWWAGLRDVLAGQEDYVVVNIGNEPYGNSGTGEWTAATSAAIGKLRAAGLRHLLMADAPNWGQDWSGVMRDNAASVLAGDPLHNTVFSVHMYGVYGTADKVTTYLDAFHERGLPLVVGEFGWKHTDGAVADEAIMRAAQERGIGYLGWSWSGNSGGVEYLDAAAGFDAERLTDWGRRLFAGIKETAREATVFATASR
ncbi:glycoside hydrolase family 5 protein [Dactylosporangium sp. AC04546]|uniref:glycoside hydrolase family 5 protein n=1 Tax=Dactylosporangium sp. AC04546 TaxID=2862460 RepID=UPI001EE0CE70|nr:glycoside hydrolase family 5 protein [Dactylosporangium sp. AC04546]WVK81294.1 glycoside hydrolase family 5 protein [Dactylosporangium sp. AC04546]